MYDPTDGLKYEREMGTSKKRPKLRWDQQDRQMMLKKSMA